MRVLGDFMTYIELELPQDPNDEPASALLEKIKLKN